MTEFKKARNEMAKEDNVSAYGDISRTARQRIDEAKRGADWAYEWCQKDKSTLHDEMIKSTSELKAIEYFHKKHTNVNKMLVDENQTLKAQLAMAKEALEQNKRECKLVTPWSSLVLLTSEQALSKLSITPHAVVESSYMLNFHKQWIETDFKGDVHKGTLIVWPKENDEKA